MLVSLGSAVIMWHR